MKELCQLSAWELKKAISSGEISATEAVEAYLEAISSAEPYVQAFNSVLADQAKAKAQVIDAKRKAKESLPLLAGLPVALKDNICTTYGYTSCSSKMLANYKAPYNATVVERLEKAGAIILGKTNMDEFAMGSSTENSGFKPTLNPWNKEHVPGGSSGGSAAAVAARECVAALGSDTGGSIRQPAAFCGVVGFKPTYGRVSRYGLVAYGSSLDQIGPITRDITDCALLTQVIAGHDEHDSTSINTQVPAYLETIDQPISKLKIGLPKEFYSAALDNEIHQAIDKAVEHFKSLGAKIVEVSLPHSRIDMDAKGELSSYAVACYYIIAMAEATSNLSRYDGVHYGYRTKTETNDIIELYSKSRSEALGEEVKRRILLGTYTLSSGYYDAYYTKALKVRRLIKNDFDQAFKQCNILLCPVAPTTAFKLGERSQDPLEMYLQDIYTLSLNLAGLPGLALPCGISKTGLPIGMQLIGPLFSEETLLRTGKMYEKASGIVNLRPPMYK